MKYRPNPYIGRGLVKSAKGTGIGFLDAIIGAFNGGAKAAVEGGKFAAKNLAIALPAVAATLAWTTYKATSPKAVADNSTEYAINAMEKETLVQSMRDWEDEKANRHLSGSPGRYHDQFI